MRQHPEQSAEIIEDRRQKLQMNMRHALAAMKAAADIPAGSVRSDPPSV
jgi:hypothetical protein